MPLIALLLFIGLPFAEIYVLIIVGRSIGALATVLLVVAIAIAGGVILRHQGVATLVTVRAALARGEMPTEAVLEGVVLFMAGALLLMPGLVTDIAACLCLLPPIRRALARSLAGLAIARVRRRGTVRQGGARVLEAEYRVEDER